jgi:hypothetical protein
MGRCQQCGKVGTGDGICTSCSNYNTQMSTANSSVQFGTQAGIGIRDCICGKEWNGRYCKGGDCFCCPCFYVWDIVTCQICYYHYKCIQHMCGPCCSCLSTAVCGVFYVATCCHCFGYCSKKEEQKPLNK